ncbi:Uncharacterised protein [Mycobacteroides abscessus subsp. abscessus]|nr:Uncharacterised protein [Mycobacteroides abscessus subsp. abscessus]
MVRHLVERRLKAMDCEKFACGGDYTLPVTFGVFPQGATRHFTAVHADECIARHTSP